ncbi:MAG: hypothetical protein WCJ46_03460 [bacterium]
MKRNLKNILILALVLISAGGAYMHLSYHSPAKAAYGWIPLVSAILSVILLPILFSFRKTLHLAYIINGFTTIIGIITMVHYSLVEHALTNVIFILIGKFLIGYVIFNMEIHNLEAPETKVIGWRVIRYPNMGFWMVHLFTLSLVYLLGNLLWR